MLFRPEFTQIGQLTRFISDRLRSFAELLQRGILNDYLQQPMRTYTRLSILNTLKPYLPIHLLLPPNPQRIRLPIHPNPKLGRIHLWEKRAEIALMR